MTWMTWINMSQGIKKTKLYDEKNKASWELNLEILTYVRQTCNYTNRT